MKPIPVTTCAAMRDTSSRIGDWKSSDSTPSKPYADIIINSAEPNDTRKCVRKPTAFSRYSRSRPITPPSRHAIRIRRIKSNCCSILLSICYENVI